VANNKSAEKRIRQQEKRRLRNRDIVGSMRTAIRKARAAVDSNADNAGELVRLATSLVDKAVTKGAVKRQTASRYISRLASRKAS
jgi:small subunit ribosomal protein S20